MYYILLLPPSRSLPLLELVPEPLSRAGGHGLTVSLVPGPAPEQRPNPAQLQPRALPQRGLPELRARGAGGHPASFHQRYGPGDITLSLYTDRQHLPLCHRPVTGHHAHLGHQGGGGCRRLDRNVSHRWVIGNQELWRKQPRTWPFLRTSKSVPSLSLPHTALWIILIPHPSITVSLGLCERPRLDRIRYKHKSINHLLSHFWPTQTVATGCILNKMRSELGTHVIATSLCFPFLFFSDEVLSENFLDYKNRGVNGSHKGQIVWKIEANSYFVERKWIVVHTRVHIVCILSKPGFPKAYFSVFFWVKQHAHGAHPPSFAQSFIADRVASDQYNSFRHLRSQIIHMRSAHQSL